MRAWALRGGVGARIAFKIPSSKGGGATAARPKKTREARLTRVVLCLVRAFAQLERVVEDLRAAGFSGDDISALLPDPYLSGVEFQGSHKGLVTERPESVSLAGLAGVEAVGIPGLGPFIAAGSILTTLGSGLMGGLLTLGVPEHEAKLYEDGARRGDILIWVSTRGLDERQRAQRIFADAGADNILSVGELSEK